jgi:hypothetical protein
MPVKLMAALSSVTLLTCAVSAANIKHAGVGGYLLVTIIALPLAVSNIWVVHKAAGLVAGLTCSLSGPSQEWVGKAFILVWLIYAVCTGVIGSWAASAALRLVTLKWIQ